jgi:hypothetical protein
LEGSDELAGISEAAHQSLATQPKRARRGIEHEQFRLFDSKLWQRDLAH